MAHHLEKGNICHTAHPPNGLYDFHANWPSRPKRLALNRRHANGLYYNSSRCVKAVCKQAEEVRLMAIDPVCGMEVDERSAQWTSQYEGQTYYFCAPGCKNSFDNDPEKYLGEEGQGGAHGSHHAEH